MGFSTKYYEGVLKGQASLPLGSETPPFDFERKRKTTLVGRAIGWFLETPDWWLRILRSLLPRFRVGKVVFLLGFEDVREVLERESEFETPYGPELREFSGGLDFLLSLKDGKLYRTQKSVVLSAFPPSEVEERVRDIAATHSQEIVRHAGEKFDAATELMRVVPIRICREYYGLDIEDDRQFGDWAISINHILFGDWNADPVTRELAVAAAKNMFAAVDRSIDIAQAAIDRGEVVDNPLGRLIHMSKDGGQVAGRQEVRAIMIGMVVGFAPTNLLGGTNCLDAVLSRPEIFGCIKKAVDEKDNARLDKAVLEAMRFKPHWIWPWRYTREEKTIGVGRSRPYRIPANVSVLPFTRSAMFDASVVRDPWTFNPDRSLSENMVFGVGIHRCIGAAIASVQVAEAFRALFERPGFRRARGKEGKLTRIGPYPDRLMVEFDAPAENRLVEQALVTVCVPVRAGADAKQLQKEVDLLGNPAAEAIRTALNETGIIHFASLAAISTSDAGTKTGDGFHLVLELSGDGSKRAVIEAFVAATKTQLQPIFERFAADSLKGPLETFLLKHAIDVSPQFGEMSGLVFAGTPGHSVARIKAEQLLANRLAELVEQQTLLAPPSTAVISDSSSAGEILKDVRRELEKEEHFDWAFSPAQSLLEKPGGTLLSATVHSIFNLRTAIPLVVLVGVFTWLTYYLQFDKGVHWFRTVARLGDSFILAVGGLILAMGMLLMVVALRLRHIEQREEINTAGIKLDNLAKLQEREDKEGYVQNHMTAVSVIKPGWWLKPGVLRRVLLRFSFYVISIAARRAYRPGYLADINTIHFARWVRIPRTDRLVFFSNYGGSWESYLEDFVTKASAGLTGIWSNTRGFPRTRFLFLDGSRDGDRFKRWARAEQIPTSFWYSAYPELNTTIIRKNSRIRQGFHAARASQARDWLSLFTSLPRQDGIKPSLTRTLLNQASETSVESLESGEIQSLIFGPLGNLEHAVMLAFEVGDGSSVAQRQEVLAHLLKHTSFGDSKPPSRAMFCVFGPQGLTKLGFAGNPDSDALGSFPPTFRQGMANDYRSRILDDQGDSAPENWSWGSKMTPVDLAMICYAVDKAKLDGMALDIGKLANRTGLISRAVVPLMIDRSSARCPVKHVAEGDEEKRPAREHFGFVDGVSQPVIKGTRRRRNHNSSPIHQIAAGEFLFGYRDEHGFYPPSPTTPAEFDAEGRLLAIDADGQPVDGRAATHDFGRNGSFVVIRQLEQHVERFNDYCREEAANLRGSGTYDFEAVDEEWIGARIVGRWKNGSSLTRNPDGPGRELDNEFTYGAEDPQGLHCPLGAHIRRSNPRDSLGTDIDTQLRISKRHRILRAGRSYVLDRNGKTEKGLLFICFNASFERQYEFIQQTWMSAQNFHGLRGEKDPLIGRQPGDAEAPRGRFTIPRWEGAVELTTLPSFITTRGGGYFFMPSRAALQFLHWRLAAS